MSVPEDSNFSRAFEQLYDDNESSSIQELVYTAIVFLEEFVDFPGQGSAKEQLKFTLNAFPGDALELEVPSERKDVASAERLLGAADSERSERKREKMFARALTLAPPGSEVLVRAFTRRGAHFLALKNYYQAVADFREALDNAENDGVDSSHELRFRLEHKLAQCLSKEKKFSEACKALRRGLGHLEAMHGDENARLQHKKVLEASLAKMSKKKKDGGRNVAAKDDGANLVLNPHPSIADVSSLISIKETPHQGRFAIARELIPAGTVIVSSDPAAAILNPDDPGAMFSHCLLCLKWCSPSSLPCPGCSGAVYCSRKCLQDDSPVHGYECKINLCRWRQTDTGNSFRIFLTLRAVLKKTLEEHLKEDSAGSKEGLFGMVFHSEEKEGDAKFKYLILSVILFRLLQQSGYIDLGDRRELDLLVLLHRLLQVQDCNTHPVLSLDKQDGVTTQVGLVKVGNAVYPQIGSYFNHSCDPNTCRVNDGAKKIMVATRSIPAGAEVTDIYSMHYSETPRERRRQWLKENFFFECGCHVCEKDWPDYETMPGQAPPAAVLGQLQQVERAIGASLREGNFDSALRLHLKDVEILESGVKEPHRLFISVRNSLQYVLWKVYGG